MASHQWFTKLKSSELIAKINNLLTDLSIIRLFCLNFYPSTFAKQYCYQTFPPYSCLCPAVGLDDTCSYKIILFIGFFNYGNLYLLICTYLVKMHDHIHMIIRNASAHTKFINQYIVWILKTSYIETILIWFSFWQSLWSCKGTRRLFGYEGNFIQETVSWDSKDSIKVYVSILMPD